MYRNGNSKNLIQSQHNSSNININSRIRNMKFVLPKLSAQNGEKSMNTISSRLPVRSRSMMEKVNSLRNNPSLPKPKFDSTSDLSNHSGKIRSASISVSRVKPITTKVELISKKSSTKPWCYSANGTHCIYKFPIHRNNSSYVGSVKFCDPKVATGSKENPVDARKSDGKGCVLGSNHSIFKFFKLKVNSYREKAVENKEVTPMESIDKKIVESKVHKRSTVNILENPKTKDFLIKLYNECKKLNGNITKLYSDTSQRHGRVKDVLDKHRSERERFEIVSRRSKSSMNINKKSDSEARTKKENEGHYYHLACVLSPDLLRTSTKQTKRSLPTNVKESEEKTTMSSVKSNISVSLSTSVVNRNGNDLGKKSSVIKNKCTFTNELDDTLCDLDEEMQTDSSEASKVDPNVMKSPISNSNYVTANDQNVDPDPKNRMSSSMELPPIPSSKDCDLSESLIKIDPPMDLDDAACIPNTPGNVSKFITVFEKQFPHRFVLRQTSTTSDSGNEDKKEPFSNFSSSITVNCTKSQKKTVPDKQGYKFFNPFKPPKCLALKLNTNNNSLDNDDDELRKNTDDKDKSTPDSEPLKRVAPMKKLMQHSRTSEQMDEVISLQRNEALATPVVNSCIEKQRQKKIARQQEQHQKAKDMAIEAARVRKERQLEMNTLDSFDSSRIVEKLFTDNNDDDFPDFSLFDAVHYNFQTKKPRQPRPLAESTITGILPEGDPEEPEPPKSPLTTEKFRNQPFKVLKKIRIKKEIDKEVLAKYESINSDNVTQKKNSKDAEVDKKIAQSTPIIIKLKTKKKYSSSSTGSSDSSSVSLTSLSASISSSSSSSSSSPILQFRKKHKSATEPRQKKIGHKIFSSKEFKVVEDSRPVTSSEFNNELARVEELVAACRENGGNKVSAEIVRETKDMQVGTEQKDDEDDVSYNTTMKASLPDKIECHLNYQSKYKDNVLDRTLPLNINIPTPNTSLSSFVEELVTQLRSLEGTVDILLRRMDVLEVNILDCSKYFV